MLEVVGVYPLLRALAVHPLGQTATSLCHAPLPLSIGSIADLRAVEVVPVVEVNRWPWTVIEEPRHGVSINVDRRVGAVVLVASAVRVRTPDAPCLVLNLLGCGTRAFLGGLELASRHQTGALGTWLVVAVLVGLAVAVLLAIVLATHGPARWRDGLLAGPEVLKLGHGLASTDHCLEHCQDVVPRRVRGLLPKPLGQGMSSESANAVLPTCLVVARVRYQVLEPGVTILDEELVKALEWENAVEQHLESHNSGESIGHLSPVGVVQRPVVGTGGVDENVVVHQLGHLEDAEWHILFAWIFVDHLEDVLEVLRDILVSDGLVGEVHLHRVVGEDVSEQVLDVLDVVHRGLALEWSLVEPELQLLLGLLLTTVGGGLENGDQDADDQHFCCWLL